MRPSRIAALTVCCLAGLALIGLTSVAVVSGAPPPTQLCGSCGAEEVGATDPGTLDVYVDDDGDSQWVERVPVNDSAAERYEDDPAVLDRAVDDAWNSGFRHVANTADGPVDRTIRIEDGTVTVTYAVDDVARPGVRDAWIVDYFAIDGTKDRYRLAADRVTIHTPEDTVVTNSPGDASVEGNAATWAASGGESPAFDRRTLLTYGPSGALGTASGYATLGLEVGPTAIERGLLAGLVPAALLGVAGVAVGRIDRGREVDRPTLQRLIVGAGAIGAVALIAASAWTTGDPFTPGLGALSALGVGYAALGIAAGRWLPDRRDARATAGEGTRRSTRPTAREVTGLAIAVAFGTGALLWLLGGSVALLSFPFALATALFLPIGYAFERGSRPVGTILLAAIAPIAAAAFAFLFVSPRGLVLVLYAIMLLGWVLVVAVFGYPIALLGRSMAREECTSQ